MICETRSSAADARAGRGISEGSRDAWGGSSGGRDADVAVDAVRFGLVRFNGEWFDYMSVVIAIRYIYRFECVAFGARISFGTALIPKARPP